MSFEPRLFDDGTASDDDRSHILDARVRTTPLGGDPAVQDFDDVELSDDLIELASQLSADASRLTLQFPPRPAVTATTAPRAAPRPQFRWRAAIALLISGITILTISHLHRQLVVSGIRTTAATHDASSGTHDMEGNVANDVFTARIELPANSARPVIAPHAATGVFHELSGPEQEAVLDLIEHRSTTQDSWEI